MTEVPAELPPPRDDDDDDVAWALQTAQVQWQRGAYMDAVTWLRRAADSALRIGATGRAWDLKLAASKLVDVIPTNPPVPLPPATLPPSALSRSSQPPSSQPFPPSAPPGALPDPGLLRAPSTPPCGRAPTPAPFPPSSPPFPPATPFPSSPPSSQPFPPSSRPFPPSPPRSSSSLPPVLRSPATLSPSSLSPSSQPPSSQPFPPSSPPPGAYPSSPPFARSTLPPASQPFPASSSPPASFPRAPSVPSFASPASPSSTPPGAFLQYSQDSGDSDPYDDGTDIIEMPSFQARPPPHRYSSEPILIEDADLEADIEELEPDVVQDGEIFAIRPSDPEIEDEPDSLLSEIDPDEDDDIEDERQSLLSDELEDEDGVPIGNPELTAASARNAASAIERRAREALLEELENRARTGVEVEADESEDEPTHKLRVDAVARRAAAARGRGAPAPAPAPAQRQSDPPTSLADELEPDSADDDPTQKDAETAHAPETRRSERPPGGIDWDDAPPSRPPASGAPRARTSVPASIPPRRASVRPSAAPAAAAKSAVPRPSAAQRGSPAAVRRGSQAPAASNRPAPAASNRPAPAASNRSAASSRSAPGARASASGATLASEAHGSTAKRAPGSTHKSASKNGVSSKQPAVQAAGELTPSAEPPPVVAPVVAPEPPEVRVAETLPEATALPEAAARESIESISELPTTPLLFGVPLDTVRGLQDLPEEAQLALARGARVESLNTEEELNGFAVALVLKGKVGIMPAIADVACAEAGVSEVVFTEGHLSEGVVLRVVASVDDTKVAFWDRSTLEAQMADCPWVADDLKSIADRFQALAGASMGSLGDRLDASLRGMVTDRCEVIRLESGETLLEAGQTVNGMYVVGAGHLELVGEGTGSGRLNPGDFLFPAQVMAGGGAPHTARAGSGGALLLRAERMAAHELLVSVPPLLEILAG